MNEIITTPFRTATPESAMKPTPAEIESGIPRSSNETTPPVQASGTPVKTIAASRAEPKIPVRIAKIRSSASGTTIWSRRLADSSCSNWPPQVLQ